MIDCDVFCTVYLFHTTRGRYQFDNGCDIVVVVLLLTLLIGNSNLIDNNTVFLLFGWDPVKS